MCRCHHFGLERRGDRPGWHPNGWDAEGVGAQLRGNHEQGAKGRGGGELWRGDQCNGMGWCWCHCGLPHHGGGAGCSTSGMFNGLATCYGGAAANEAGAEHPLPLCGHCMFTMVMRVIATGFRGFLAKHCFRLLRTC